MGDAERLEVFIYSSKDPQAIEPTIALFTGTPPPTLRCEISVVSPPDCHHAEDVKWDPDYAMVVDALRRADKNSYTIICKDTAISALKSETILRTIDQTICMNKSVRPFDLFYLAKWLDRCDLYSDPVQVGGRGLKVVNTVSPHGILTLMFTPQGRHKFLEVFNPETHPITDRPLGRVLNSRIGDHQDGSADAYLERFIAITATPNIVNFDINARHSDRELVKSAECREIPESLPAASCSSGGTTRTNMSLFWFIILVIVIILLAIILVRVGMRWCETSGVPIAQAPISAGAVGGPITPVVPIGAIPVSAPYSSILT